MLSPVGIRVAACLQLSGHKKLGWRTSPVPHPKFFIRNYSAIFPPAARFRLEKRYSLLLEEGDRKNLGPVSHGWIKTFPAQMSFTCIWCRLHMNEIFEAIKRFGNKLLIICALRRKVGCIHWQDSFSLPFHYSLSLSLSLSFSLCTYTINNLRDT